MLVNEPCRPADRVDDVAHHLRAKLGELLAQALVGQVVKCHPVPAPAGAHNGGKRIAGASEQGLKLRELRLLGLGHGEPDEYDTLHVPDSK